MTEGLALEFPDPGYTGHELTAEDVESLRAEYGARRGEALQQFRALEAEYQSLSSDVSARMDGPAWEAQLERLKAGKQTSSGFRGVLERVGLARKPRPVAELLEEQLEDVQRKLHRVTQMRESIEQHATAIEDDIARLNQDTIRSAHNEERAAATVLELSQQLEKREQEVLYWDPADRESAAFREATAMVDDLKRMIRLHGSKARAYSHAENRLASIVTMNRAFLEMLQHTAENMDQLTAAASQVVDEIAGSVRALSSLSLASEIALDLMESSKRLKAGINRVATAASAASLELTREVDRFTSDLSIYDDATVARVQLNLSEERRLRQEQVEAAIAHAWESRA